MKTRTLLIAGLIVLLLLAGGFWLYDWVLGETEAASSPIEAVPLEVDPTSPPATEIAAAAAASSTPESEPDPGTGAAAAGVGPGIYTIQPSGSEVRFTIYEELRGAPTDVVGVSDQVAGELAVDLDDLSTARVGEIRVNARTLATDQDRRNSAIRNRILFTDSYEFITFSPQEIRGLNGSASPGEEFSFEIAGELTIKDLTRPVVFSVTARAESAEQIRGTASAVIQRSEFELGIPSVPGVANVGEEVLLEIDFTAVRES